MVIFPFAHWPEVPYEVDCFKKMHNQMILIIVHVLGVLVAVIVGVSEEILSNV